MTNNEKLAAELVDEILGSDMIDDITPIILEALNTAHADGYREGAEKMREDAVALIAATKRKWAQDMSSNGLPEVRRHSIVAAADALEKGISALPITPQKEPNHE